MLTWFTKLTFHQPYFPKVTTTCIFRGIEPTLSTKYRKIKTALCTHIGAMYICAEFEQVNLTQHVADHF